MEQKRDEQVEPSQNKIIFINLGIYFIVTFFELFYSTTLSDKGANFVFLSAVTLGIQTILNLVISIYFFLKGELYIGILFFVSPFIVLLIGFPLCFAGGILW